MCWMVCLSCESFLLLLLLLLLLYLQIEQLRVESGCWVFTL